MILLDASVLIAYLDGADAHHRRAVALLEREVDDELAVSTLTLAEVLVGAARGGRMADALAALGDLEVAERMFPADAAMKLAVLRASTGLRMPDCCVLLSAQEDRARVASFDARLIASAESLGLASVS
jgi:predicted nucleic acid-binding protein